MQPQSSIAVAAFARVVLRDTGLVVVVIHVLGFYILPTAKVLRRPNRAVKNGFNTLFLFFINWVGRVISLDCQYIIRVAEESCSNCSLLPKSDDTDCFISSPEPKAHGELMVYQSSRRLCVHVCVHTFKHLLDLWTDRNQILSEASMGRGKGCIRFWARSDQNSGVHGNE